MKRHVVRILFAAFIVVMASHRARADGRLIYNRDVRPILSENCFYCHGPDKNHRDGKFRLDEKDSAVAKGAILPGKPEKSELVARILSAAPDDVMPPPKTHKRLTDAQKETLRRWISEGAEYQPHWAYITPTRPATPKVADADAKRVRNPIDAFALHEVEARKLAPSPEADRRTLLRRLSLDLIGLPPAPAEVQAFLDDRSPNAYEKQVDRLLASPHYGERMAAPWLDVVRFADTVGFHGDQNANVFPYRDYVISSFNSNKPFDRFTIEQLAGDLLPDPTTEQLVATGFNRLNMVTREGGAQPKEYLARYAADRVRTVAMAFLGSTFGCAECHDHKFDPISTADFYALGAYFADVKQWGVYTDYPYTPNPDLAGFSNNHPFPPEIMVDSPVLKRRMEQKRGELAEAVAAIGHDVQNDRHRRATFERWKSETREFLLANPSGWLSCKPMDSALPKGASIEGDTAVLAGKMADDRLEFESPAATVAAIRIELLPHAKHDGSVARVVNRAARTPEVLFTAALERSGGGKAMPIRVERADADFKDPVYENGAEVIGVGRVWTASAAHIKEPQAAVYILQTPLRAAKGDRVVFNFKQCTIGCLRISVSPVAPTLPPSKDFAEKLLGAIASADTTGNVLPLLTYLSSTASDRDDRERLVAIEREIAACRGGKSPTLVTQAWEPRVTRVLRRGNWQDEGGPIVRPSPPHFLPQSSKPTGRATRLDLAKWIVSADNPLTSRTVVNRFWKQFFGTGLCASVDDLGAQGEWPSHPELLDWLAVEFRESGWDVKHIVRLMVTSSTYRQASNLSPKARESDPANRLMSAQSPRRLDAEFVRDNALFAAGLLELDDIGGPSARPYQPAGYYENIQFPTRDYVADADERQYRRGVYTHWQRTFLHPMLANFDAPSREECIAARTVSNTPQQALTLLNDPTFVEAARALALRAMAAGKTDDKRLNQIFSIALSRSPKPRERESLAAFLSDVRARIASKADDPAKMDTVGLAPVPDDTDLAELAAWTNVCRVVLNLHESITRY
jgi:hypothetical protein